MWEERCESFCVSSGGVGRRGCVVIGSGVVAGGDCV